MEELGGSNTIRKQAGLPQAGHAKGCARLRHTKGPSTVGSNCFLQWPMRLPRAEWDRSDEIPL